MPGPPRVAGSGRPSVYRQGGAELHGGAAVAWMRAAGRPYLVKPARGLDAIAGCGRVAGTAAAALPVGGASG